MAALVVPVAQAEGVGPQAVRDRQLRLPSAVFDTPSGPRRDTLIISCYVDDLFIVYNSADEHSLYHRFVTDLQRRWDVADEGDITDLLTIEISREGASVVLRQRAYIEKLARSRLVP